MDGTPGALPGGVAGVAAVLRDRSGAVLAWRCARRPALTCNAAEYQAVIFGLELVLAIDPAAWLCCLSDSRVVVEQLSGAVAVRAGGLQPLHAQAVALARRLPAVRFLHIPRELNQLADALAWEALGGRRRLIAHVIAGSR